MPHKPLEEPASKLSGKNFGYLAGAAMLLTALGFLFYPGNLGGHIGNIKNYFKPAPNLQETTASANMVQNTPSKQMIIPAVQGSDKTDGTQFQSTGLAAEGIHLPAADKKNVMEPQKEYRINNLSSAEDVDPEKFPDKTNKLQEVSEYETITPRKYTINFSHNSYDFSDKNAQTLKRIAGLLVQHPKTGIIVKGYTDAYGNVEHNKKLSELRAHSIKSYFVDQGINSSRIEAFGMGQKNPIESNNTPEGRKQNRRVEIELNFNNT
jgi:outer membrane protein OmpA-like peptidoglycan-associated protein